MKSSLLLSLVTIALILPAGVNAQDLLVGYDMFSRKKTAYVTLSDGSTMEGTITKVKRKKGLFEFIAIEDANGKKHELDPADIDHMYLPPSGLNKFATASFPRRFALVDLAAGKLPQPAQQAVGASPRD